MKDQSFWYLENIDVQGIFCPKKLGASEEQHTYKTYLDTLPLKMQKKKLQKKKEHNKKTIISTVNERKCSREENMFEFFSNDGLPS